ncbi:MAG: polysaccharide biosynthesis protein [Oculatellaceae cyanobacterium Prado106]|nr:polysaccharide biosynthesis protein [Oculatellaceae cyanobacterium Prado106]
MAPTSTLSLTDLIAQIQTLVPPGSPEPQDPQLIATLQNLTQQLIQAYQADGLLQGDPFAEVWVRGIHLYETEVRDRLSHQVVLITGGEGCVGTCLMQKLLQLGVKRIVSVDKARCTEETVEGEAGRSLHLSGIPVIQYAADIRNLSTLDRIFATEKPDIVFHLAAQRLPWLAEQQILETITNNIFGTQNVIQVCETHQVKQCIVSSTGKASRYLTGEVYAASKKMMEWQLAQAVQQGKVTYGMVRFTHMLDNSSFCEQYDQKIQQGRPVNIHAPHRYVVGQNLQEATHLLLNALVFAEPKRLKFLLCRNLGWPVETLEVALYKIQQSGQPNFIYFQGVTVGYEESFFRGQVDWSQPTEINTLINVIECATKTIDASGDLILSEVPAFSTALLQQQLTLLQDLCHRPLPPAQLKTALAAAVSQISASLFRRTPAETLLKILHWGTELNHLKAEGTAAEAFEGILALIIQGLQASLKRASAKHPPDVRSTLLQTAAKEIAHLQVCLHQLSWQPSADLITATADLAALLQTLQVEQSTALPYIVQTYVPQFVPQPLVGAIAHHR